MPAALERRGGEQLGGGGGAGGREEAPAGEGGRRASQEEGGGGPAVNRRAAWLLRACQPLLGAWRVCRHAGRMVVCRRACRAGPAAGSCLGCAGNAALGCRPGRRPRRLLQIGAGPGRPVGRGTPCRRGTVGILDWTRWGSTLARACRRRCFAWVHAPGVRAGCRQAGSGVRECGQPGDSVYIAARDQADRALKLLTPRLCKARLSFSALHWSRGR